MSYYAHTIGFLLLLAHVGMGQESDKDVDLRFLNMSSSYLIGQLNRDELFNRLSNAEADTSAYLDLKLEKEDSRVLKKSQKIIRQILKKMKRFKSEIRSITKHFSILKRVLSEVTDTNVSNAFVNTTRNLIKDISNINMDMSGDTFQRQNDEIKSLQSTMVTYKSALVRESGPEIADAIEKAIKLLKSFSKSYAFVKKNLSKVRFP
ncbi:unnamed protein product, partial [Owenia fusiformis]